MVNKSSGYDLIIEKLYNPKYLTEDIVADDFGLKTQEEITECSKIISDISLLQSNSQNYLIISDVNFKKQQVFTLF